MIFTGFFMLQESVYCRMVINEAMARSVVAKIETFKPPAGTVCVIIVTERQFSGMSYITGEYKSDVVTSDKSVVII